MNYCKFNVVSGNKTENEKPKFTTTPKKVNTNTSAKKTRVKKETE